MATYCGRNDDMVKLHGYRIELEDITAAISRVKGVINGATIGLKSNGETKKIVSFYTGDEQIEKEAINSSLKQQLPEYMIPSDVLYISEIPFNASGKLDYLRLKEFYLNRGK